VVNPWRVVFTRQAKKDARNLGAAGLGRKAQELLEILRADPFQSPPPFEKLGGELAGMYSRRINRQHRLVYEIYPEEHAIKVLSLWSHYERL
jgi:Txe/YoeB family toxin of toxin-antitoxin system